MANAPRQFESQAAPTKSVVEVAAALLLISMGVVFQLGELGYSHLAPENFWFATMLAQGVWNFIVAHCDVQALQQSLRYWPLILVVFGMGILFMTKRGSSVSVRGVSLDRGGSDHAG